MWYYYALNAYMCLLCMQAKSPAMLTAHNCCSLLLLHCKCCKSLQHTLLPHITVIAADSARAASQCRSLHEVSSAGLLSNVENYELMHDFNGTLRGGSAQAWGEQFQVCWNIITQNLFALKFYGKYYKKTADDKLLQDILHALHYMHTNKCSLCHMCGKQSVHHSKIDRTSAAIIYIHTSPALLFCSNEISIAVTSYKHCKLDNHLCVVAPVHSFLFACNVQELCRDYNCDMFTTFVGVSTVEQMELFEFSDYLSLKLVGGSNTLLEKPCVINFNQIWVIGCLAYFELIILIKVKLEF